MRLAAFALAAFLCGCASGPVDLATAAPVTNLPLVTLCHNNPSLPELEQESYCGSLRNAKEPLAPVTNLGATREAYRLIWLRSFDPGIIIRAEIISPRDGLLSVTSLEHTREPDGEVRWNSRLVFQQTLALTEDEIKTLRDSSATLSFWRLPHEFDLEMDFGSFSSAIPRDIEIIQSDGAQWIVEGIAADRYQVIGSSGDGPPGTLGLALLNLVHGKMPDFVIGPIY